MHAPLRGQHYARRRSLGIVPRSVVPAIREVWAEFFLTGPPKNRQCRGIAVRAIEKIVGYNAKTIRNIGKIVRNNVIAVRNIEKTAGTMHLISRTMFKSPSTLFQ